MIYTYNITETDMLNAMQLHRKTVEQKWLLVVQYIVLPLWMFFNHNDDLMRGFIGAACMLLAIVIIRSLILYGLYPWMVKRDFKQSPYAHKELSLELKKEALSIHNKDGGGLIKYEDIIRWSANKALTLVYLSPRLYYIFPQHLAEQGLDFESFHKTLNEKVAPQGQKNVRIPSE